MDPGQNFRRRSGVGEANIESGSRVRGNAIPGQVWSRETGERAGSVPVILGGRRIRIALMNPVANLVGYHDELFERILAQPGSRGVTGLAGGLELDLQDSLFFDHHLGGGAPIRHDGHLAAQPVLFEQGTSAVFSAAFFVSGDREAKRDARGLQMKVAEKLEHDGHDSLHVAGPRTADPSILQVGAIGFAVGMVDDIDMAKHEDIRRGAVLGERDQGVNAVRLVTTHLDRADGFEVVADPLDGASKFLRAFFGPGDQNEIAGQGDQAFAEAGGVEGRGDRFGWLVVAAVHSLVAIEDEIFQGEDALDERMNFQQISAHEKELPFAYQIAGIKIQIDGENPARRTAAIEQRGLVEMI